MADLSINITLKHMLIQRDKSVVYKIKLSGQEVTVAEHKAETITEATKLYNLMHKKLTEAGIKLDTELKTI